jgi:hypothetical protein
MATIRIFISSVQKELAAERRALKEFVHNDALLKQHFEVFLFEDLAARDQRADKVYLDEVDRCDLYVGVFGMEYGYSDGQGLSPTEQEFDRATDQGKVRLIYVKGADDTGRDARMTALVRKAGDQLVRRRFGTTPELTAELFGSLIDHLQRTGIIRSLPFDAAACRNATLDDIDGVEVLTFVAKARTERGFALRPMTPKEDVLRHLNLLDQGAPSHAAVLLFASEPQRFLISSEVKCMQYHGTSVSKPIPDYKIYKGNVFGLVDQAVDFVMRKLASSVGTRAAGNAAPVAYEIPREAVAEAIVNAVAHRDYASNASVQVMLFADRLEVWNPGAYPPELPPEALRHAHSSIPRNPLIAEPMFLARYIEKAGTGTLDMIAQAKAAGLAPPDFRQIAGQVVQVLWRPVADPAMQVTMQVEALRTSVLSDLASVLGQPTIQVTIQVAIQVARMLEAVGKQAYKSAVLQRAMGLQSLDHFRRAYRSPLITADWLAMTDPANPNSPQQRYRLTPKGKEWLDHFNALPKP